MLDFGKIVLSMKDERILEALVRFDVAKIRKFGAGRFRLYVKYGPTVHRE